jgi:y4mF family transcriptional regulator
MLKGDIPFDWAMGEILAFASLLLSKTPIRLSGQDSTRGTFSHRHSVWVDTITEDTYCPLNHLSNSHSEKVKEWVNNLKEIGHAPVVKVLEYVSLEEDIDGRERYWIQREINKGSLLLNSFLITPLLIESKLDNLLGNGEDMESFKIGVFIKERRKRLKMNQEEFAGRAGVALTVVRKLEQGKTNLNIDSLLQVLKMFGCTIDVIKIK